MTDSFNITGTDKAKEDKHKQEIRTAGKQSLIHFGKLFIPEHFNKSKPPKVHYDMSNSFLSRQNHWVANVIPRGFAKAQDLSSRVMTPNGWTTIGELEVGDCIIGYNGREQFVQEVHPIEKMELFRVTTRDGRNTLCNADHLWTVTCPSNTGNKLITKPIREIAENYQSERYDKRDGTYHTECRYFLPTHKPIKYSPKKYIIDPYTLGAWLGDGHSNGGGFTSADPELVGYFPYEVRKRKGKYVYGILNMLDDLRALNLINNKHIPKQYLRGSIKQRTRLLQGLIDTDGTIQKDGHIACFSTTLDSIKDGIVELVRGLGGTATVGDQWNTYEKGGEVFHSYHVGIRLPKEIIPARLKRKRDIWRGSLKTKSAIVDIRFEKVGYGRCITVSNDDGLYITDDYMVTHNSLMSQVAILYKLYYNDFDYREFVAFISESRGQAIDRISFVKWHILNNEKLRYYFGELMNNKCKNTEAEFMTFKGDRVIALGAGQKGRGRAAEQGERYTKIIVDDFESELNTKTPESRDFIKRWLKGTIIPALDESKGNEGDVWLSGTIVHYDTYLQEILDGWRDTTKEGTNYVWDVNFCRAEENGKATWEDYFPMSKLAEKRMLLGNSMFAQEYLNEARDPATAKFKVDRINYEHYRLVTQGNHNYIIKGDEAIPVNTNLGVDMAYKQREEHDFQVILPLHMDYQKNIYITPFYHEHSSLYELPTEIVRMAKENNPRHTNIEEVGAQGVIKDAVRDMEQKDKKAIRGATIGIRPPTGISKEDKLEAGIAPYVNGGKLYLVKDNDQMNLVHEELWHFPKAKNDDIGDGIWLALQKLRPPKSEPFPKSELKDIKNKKKSERPVLYNWQTGMKKQ